jgi:putative spermidine/putrescine transport system permease protein
LISYDYTAERPGLIGETPATPVLLGGPQFRMMAPVVYDQFSGVSNWPFGAALAFILLAVTLLMIVVGSALMGKKYGSAH